MAQCEVRSINLLAILLTSTFAITGDLASSTRGIDGPTKLCHDPPDLGICWRGVSRSRFTRLVHIVLAYGLHTLLPLEESGDVPFIWRGVFALIRSVYHGKWRCFVCLGFLARSCLLSTTC